MQYAVLLNHGKETNNGGRYVSCNFNRDCTLADWARLCSGAGYTTGAKMTDKKATSFRLAAETVRQLEALRKKWGDTTTAAVSRAIQMAYLSEGLKNCKKK